MPCDSYCDIKCSIVPKSILLYHLVHCCDIQSSQCTIIIMPCCDIKFTFWSQLNRCDFKCSTIYIICCSMILLTFLLKHFTVPLQCHQHSMLGHHKTLLCLQCFIVFYHSILSPLSCPIVTSKYIIKSSQDPILPWQCLMLSVDYCDLTTLLCHQSVLL